MKDFYLFDFSIGGVNHPLVNIHCKINKNNKLKLIVDNKEVELVDSVEIGTNYVQNLLLKKQVIDSKTHASVDRSGKILQLFLVDGNNEYLIKEMNIGIYKRVLWAIKHHLKSFGRKILRVPRTIVKTIKLMWLRHHFLIPPKRLKQYLRSFFGHVSDSNIYEHFGDPLDQNEYLRWLSNHENTINYEKFDYNPLISIVVPVYNADREVLEACIDSVLNQSYDNLEICLADDHSTKTETIECLKEYEKKDNRIKVVYREKNGHISEATNSAIEISTGEFIGLLDNDDVLHKDALYEVVKVLNKDKKIDMIYSDEDKIDLNGKRYFPHFKPDFSPDTLLSSNYICHFTVLRKKIVLEIGGFRGEYNGSQDYDMILRCIELSSPEKIYHLPKVVYHWRMHANSTAADPESKLYCYEAGERAIQDHLKRVGYEATVKMYKPFYGYYHVYYTIKDNPLVSVIIPNKDGKETLKRCIDSLFNVNEYKNIEVIVVENNSTTSEIFDYYKEVQAAHGNVHVVTWPGRTFNYSAINNFGVKEAKGEYLLFLNNDTEMIARDSITELVGHCQLPYTGAAGAKLLYEDDTVQHAGVIIGLGGVANNAFQHIGKMEPGYMQRPLVCANYSAVTGACMMVKKELFEKVNGFDEDLAVAYNDVDLCLKLRQLGLYNVCDAFSLWHHYESISRGYEDTPEKKARLEKESEIFRNKWPEIFAKGDPYYSPNFSTDKGFELRKLSGAAKN